MEWTKDESPEIVIHRDMKIAIKWPSDVTKTWLYGVLTLVSLVITVSIGFFSVRDLIAPGEQEPDLLSLQEQELQLVSSVEYAMSILPDCNIPDDQKINIEFQLNQALNLLKLQHNLYRADQIYGNIDDKLLDWCSTSSEQVQPPEDEEIPPAWLIPPEDEELGST